MQSADRPGGVPGTAATAWGTGDGEPFIGREWVLTQIDSWLTAAAPGWFLLCGGPGTGKSRLAQRLVELSSGTVPADGLAALGPEILAAVHICRAQDDATRAPLRVVEALANQLAARFPPFQAALVRTADPVQVRVEQHVEQVAQGGLVAGVVVQVVGTVSARAAFDQLLRRPLQALAAAQPSQQVVVLIDALDESLGYPDPDGLVGLLAAAALPTQVRLLLTSRPDPRVTDALGRPNLDLTRDQPKGVDDVRAYALARLTTSRSPVELDQTRRQGLAERVAKESHGNFLYARYVLDELHADPARLTADPPTLNLPKGLSGIYAAFLERELGRLGGPAREQQWRDVYRPLLGALAVAQGDGLTHAQLVDVTALTRSRVDDALRAAAQYLVGVDLDGPVRIYHQSFRDYLLDDGPHCVYGDEANNTLTRALIDRVPHGADTRGRDWLRADEYTRTHLASHAGAAGLLDDLVTDPGFLLAADRDRLVRALPATVRVDGQQAADVYRSALHNLRDRPPAEAAAYFQLAAREYGADDLADSVDRLGLALPWSVPWARQTRAYPHLTLGTHLDRVSGVAVTALDGHPVAVTGGGDEDATVRVWDLADGTQLHQLSGHSRGVSAVAVGVLNGQPVAVTGAVGDGIVRVWDLADGTQLHQLSGHSRGVSALAVISMDGRTVAVTGGGYDDATVRVWDLADGTQLHELSGHSRGIRAIAVTTVDGRPIAVTGAGGDDGTVRVWDLRDGTQRHQLSGHSRGVKAIAVTTLNGQPIAVTGAAGDGTVRVWDLRDGTQRHQLPGHTHGGSAIAVGAQDDQPVAVTGAVGDGIVRVWDLTDGSELHQLPGHSGGVRAIAVGVLNGQPVAVTGAGGDDGTVRVWDLARGIQLHQLLGRTIGVSAVAVTTLNGQPIAVTGGGDGTVRVWDLARTAAAGKEAGDDTNGSVGDVHAVGIATLDGHPVAVTGGLDDGTVRVWDLARGVQVHRLNGHSHGVGAVAVGALDGRPVAVTGGLNDGTVRVWDLVDGSQRPQLPGHNSGARAIAVTTLNGQPIAVTGGGDGTVRVWDLRDGTQRHQLPGHTDAVTAIAVGILDGRPIAVTGGGDDDGTVRVWDLRDGTQRHQLLGHTHGVGAVAVTNLDGRPVAVSGGSLGDGVIRVWDLAGGTQLHQLASGTIGVNAIAVGALDGHPIAVTGGSYDSMVGVWDLAGGTRLHQLPGHTDGVNAIAVGALDDRLIAIVGSGYDDGAVRVWDPVEGRQLRTIHLGPSVWVVAIDPRQVVILGTLTGLVALRLHR